MTTYFLPTMLVLIALAGGITIGIIGLAIIAPSLRSKAYASGLVAGAHARSDELLLRDQRIQALNLDIGALRHKHDEALKAHQLNLEKLLQDADRRIAFYSRRANPLAEQDLATLDTLCQLLETAAAAFAGYQANEKATLARQLQQRVINMAQRLRALPAFAEEIPA